MHFHFNFGDQIYDGDDNSLWLQIGVSLIGAFFGFGFSLYLYYLQQQSDKKKAQMEAEIETDNIMIYFKELLISVEKLFTRHLSLIDEYIDNQNKDLSSLQQLVQITNNDFERLMIIDNKGLFEAWNKKFKQNNAIEDYKKVNSSLDFLNGLRKEHYRSFFNNSKDCYSQFLEVKRIVDSLPTRLSTLAFEIARELGEKRWSDPYYVFIDNSIKQYHELLEQEPSLEVFNEQFLFPLLKGHVEDFKHKPAANEIIVMCKEARVKLTDTKRNVQQVLDSFSKARALTEEHIQRIKDAIVRIEFMNK